MQSTLVMLMWREGRRHNVAVEDPIPMRDERVLQLMLREHVRKLIRRADMN